MQRLRSYLNNSRGQAMVEFALVLPILLLLVMGMLEFGRVMHEYIMVTEAARVGARAAVVNNSDSAVRNIIVAAVPTIKPENVAISPGEGARTPGNPVTVTVTSTVNIITPLISNILPNPYLIRQQAVMRL